MKCKQPWHWHSSVRATGIHMDGAAKARRQLFITSCTKWKACRCLLNLIACRHNNGLFKWILCASASTGFLCRVAQSDRIGHNNENDSTSADLGTASDLHSGTLHLIPSPPPLSSMPSNCQIETNISHKYILICIDWSFFRSLCIQMYV